MKRRSNPSSSSSIIKKIKSDDDSLPECEKIFSSCQFYMLKANFPKGRLKIYQNLIIKYGGDLIDEISSQTNNITVIVHESIDKEKYLKLAASIPFLKEQLKVIICNWINECIKDKTLVDFSNFIVYELKPEDNPKILNETIEDSKPTKILSDAKEKAPDCIKDTPHTSKGTPTDLPDNSDVVSPAKFQSKFACAHSSKSNIVSPNAHITHELKKLLEVYQAKNDTWRVVGYQKAIKAIENYPEPITTYETAISLPGVGDKLALKVVEIVNSGKLRKVESVYGSEETKVITKFLGVWGAGPSTANAWYAQGYRTLAELAECSTLTRHQKIGVRLYDDLNDRIPRDEVKEIHEYVSKCTTEVKEGLIAEVCGSYRRGKPSCGDVDVLITHPDGMSHVDVFMPLLDVMRKKGFLTDDLVTQENNGSQQKYLGVCKLDADRKHRRLDIIVVPYSEYAPALLYFTGSAHFNRSMRLLATKLGMSLSEHGLRKNVVRQGHTKLNQGVLLETPTEESIFKLLGLPYRPPNERDL